MWQGQCGKVHDSGASRWPMGGGTYTIAFTLGVALTGA
jgi:hypothetical protein